MNLYRLDPALPTDPLWRRLYAERSAPGEPFVGGAIQAARVRAKRLDRDVTVSKIDGRTLRVSVVRVVKPGDFR